ncbi:MAG: hypothetical protein WBA10_00330 [Elainellaceae cyanobacterium]
MLSAGYKTKLALTGVAIAGIKGSSVNAIANEAIEQWLEDPVQKDIIKKFNLAQLDEIQ